MSVLIQYPFDNDERLCNAAVYNFYEILEWLGYTVPKKDTMCWIRNYKDGTDIKTVDELQDLVENDIKKLRISFFSHELKNKTKMIESAMTGNLPEVNEKMPQNLFIYTIWFHRGKMCMNLSKINNNLPAVGVLFNKMITCYCQYLGTPEPPRKYSSYSVDE